MLRDLVSERKGAKTFLKNPQCTGHAHREGFIATLQHHQEAAGISKDYYDSCVL